MTDYQDPAGESELRRRAAGLLGMLVLVAALFVTLMLLFLNNGSGKPSPNGIKPLPTAPPTSTPTSAPQTTPPTSTTGQHSAAPTGTPHGLAPNTGSSTVPIRHKHHAHHNRHTKHRVTVPPRVVNHRVKCPDASPCIAPGDIGNAVVAINAYREQHGERAVSGAVTHAAQMCALTNGGQCPDHWAETQVPRATGAWAVRKSAALTDLLDPNLVSLQVGWAYYPAGHEYFFAVIRNDS